MIINKKKNYKKIIIICVIILLLFLITIILVKYNEQRKLQKYLEQETARVKQYTALTDFKTIEEVSLYLDCKFIKKQDSKVDKISYDIYMELPVNYENSDNSTTQKTVENKGFTEKLIQYSSYVLKYKNFRIIDEKNKTSIIVICNEEQQLVSKYSINNIENYFDVMKNNEQLEKVRQTKSIEITDIEVTSEKLKNIINNNWQTKNLNLGTIESTYRNYDIYFNEGIQIKNVSGKVFNIIFTDKYQETIINNLNANSTKQEIEKTLGKPQFESGSLIGYKGKNLYVFFYENQVSIYRIENYDTQQISEIIEKKSSNNQNEKVFVDEIKNVWKDYDIYEYSENKVKLQYTLKGIVIKYDSTTQKGVILYNNFNGKVVGDITYEQIINKEKPLPDYIFIENSDLVFEQEKSRVNTLDDSSSGNNYSSNGVILNTSKKFKIYKKSVNQDGDIYNIRFISINNEFPNSELREMMCNGIWYDDNNFIYSVKNRGIFVYNPVERTYKTLITDNDKEFTIRAIVDNVLYFDTDGKIEINLN